jgi:DNA-binding CsgD family transcriptional regulator/tetratricopeptide (TPR) repeat protein
VARRITSADLIERSEELTALRDALTGAADASPSISLVAGEPGVGKSRLVAELKRTAERTRWLVLMGGCLELEEGEWPYLPIIGALRDADWGAVERVIGTAGRGELARIFPELGAVSPRAADAPYSPGRLHELLLLVMRGLSRSRPVLLILEDLHWADRSTREFVGYLARNLSDERLAVVVTHREAVDPRDPLSQLVGELLRHGIVERHTLAPLTREGTAALLAGILGEAATEELVDGIYASSQGNPFYAEELLAAGSGGTLREVVLARCARLSPAALQIVRLAAAAGRPLGPELVAAAGVEEPAAWEAIREAIGRYILASDPEDGTIAFRHAIVRTVVYDDLLAGERRALHAAIARALEPAGAHPAELAHHWNAAGDEPAALAAAIRAGAAAATAYASEEAAEQFANALALWDRVAPAARPAGADRIDLLAHAAEAARATADFDRAVGYCREALEPIDAGAEPVRAARFHERIGRYRAWDLEGSLACYARALELLPDEPTADRARVLGDEALTLMLMVRWEEAAARAHEALAVAGAAGARAEEGYARATLGLVLAYLGDLAAGERELVRAVALVEEHSHAEDCARAYMHLAEIKRLAGSYHEAMELTRKGIAVAERLGAHGAFGTFMVVNLAEDLFRLGRWDEAAATLAELESRPSPITAALFRDTLAGELAVARGDFDAARASFERAEAGRESGIPSELLPSLGSGLAELALWERRADAALEHVRATLAAVGDAEDRMYTPIVYAMGVRVAAELAERPGPAAEEHRARARAFVARLRELLAGSGPLPLSAAAHLRLAEAELTRALGRSDPAAWAEAAQAWDRLEFPYPAAYARFRQAEASPASEAVAGAHAAAATLGAVPLQLEIEALARRARVALAGRRTVRVPTAGDALGLTRREVEVLKLVADGLSNREIARRLFISDNTAGVHVSHILSKLNVSSRVTAAGVAHRAGLLDQPPDA